MTLIELLVTMLIISILAAALLGVAAVAGETAREAKSRSMVTRLHTLLMEHLDTYKSRRIKFRKTNGVNDGIEDLIVEEIPRTLRGYVRSRGEALQEARLYAMREIMLMEIPDRWSDVYLNPLAAPDEGTPFFLADRTDFSNVYLRRLRRLFGRTNTVTGNLNTVADILQNQGAECLYMIITTAAADGEARSLFSENNFGDTDGDGAPEFLDGWGHPISFLRWAPGFESDIQLNLPALEQMVPEDANRAVASDHDPFDLFRVELIAFRLVPLIYSAGQDEELGIYREDTYVVWRKSPSSPITVNRDRPYFTNGLSPYVLGALPAYLGARIDSTAIDNIHNHLLGER